MSKKHAVSAGQVLAGLNEQQRAAVQHDAGPARVIASAGSGKTRVIAHSIAYLVIARGVAASSIVAITFTNKARSVIQGRLRKLLGATTAAQVTVSTFHAFGFELLSRYSKEFWFASPPSIIDAHRQFDLIEKIYEAREYDARLLHPRAAMDEIDWAKNHAWTPADLAARAVSRRDKLAARVYRRYETALRKANVVDLGDLVHRVVHELEANRDVRREIRQQHSHIYIDEFQDANPAQYRLIRAISKPGSHVTCVGDLDQAIYGWRGADPALMKAFETDFPTQKTFLLERNYRSSQTIVAAAQAIIEKNPGRHASTPFTENPTGKRIQIRRAADEKDEAKLVVREIERLRDRGAKLNSIAIAYRMTVQSLPFERALTTAGIPYTVVRGSPYFGRDEIRDVLAYLRMAAAPDDVAVARTLQSPARGIGKQTIGHLVAQAKQRRSTLWSLLADHDFPRKVSGAHKSILREYVELIRDLQKLAAEQSEAVHELYDRVLKSTGYVKRLLDRQTEDAADRALNVQELGSLIRDHEVEHPGATVSDYLAAIALSEAESKKGSDGDRVTLTTLHGAKGLEFDNVLIVGCETGIIPLIRPDYRRDHHDRLAEERRLFFVGITRAGKRLYISHAASRGLHGRRNACTPSPYLFEIPKHLVRWK